MSLERQRLGHYVVRTLLGKGGVGEVYLANDLRSARQVAIKVMWAEEHLSHSQHSNRRSLRPFWREMKAFAILKHPHILPVLRASQKVIQGRVIAYMVMPYCEDGSLDQWLQRTNTSGLLAPDVVADITSQLADALEYAHASGIVHQDVKPSNVLIHRNALYPEVLLADFGIAKFLHTISSSGQAVRGTHEYMAPEQWNGEPIPATDQYALAIMVYELLTGSLPFQADSPARLMYQHLHVKPRRPSALNPSLSTQIDSVLLRALEKEPHKRFPSISAFATALHIAVRSRSTFRSVVEDKEVALDFEEMEYPLAEEDEPILPLRGLPPRRQPVFKEAGERQFGAQWPSPPKPLPVRRRMHPFHPLLAPNPVPLRAHRARISFHESSLLSKWWVLAGRALVSLCCCSSYLPLHWFWDIARSSLYNIRHKQYREYVV